MKKVLCISLVLSTILALVGCSSNDVSKSNSNSESNIVQETTEAIIENQGFDSSEDAIKAYWAAFDKVSGFETCFPKGSNNFDANKLVEDQYTIAKKVENTVIITDVEITDKTTYNLTDFKFDASLLNITEAEKNTVTVYMDQLINDTDTAKVADYYNFITVKIDNRWYVLNIEDTGAERIDSEETTTETGITEITTELPTTEIITESNIETNIESIDVETTTEVITEPTTEDSNIIENSYLSEDVATALKYVQTDYSKIAWGVEYSPIEDAPGIVVSATMANDVLGYSLIIGITNLYDKPITVSAEGFAKDLSGSNTGDFSIYAEAIGSGNTYITAVRCTDMPSGEIHWDSIESKDSYKTYVPWEADWGIKTEEDKSILEYTITGSGEFTVGDVYGLALDSNGFIKDVFHSYESQTTDNFIGKIESYLDAKELEITDVALFANPTSIN